MVEHTHTLLLFTLCLDYVHVTHVHYHIVCCNLHSLSSGDLSVILSSEIKNAKEKGKQNITSLKACSFYELSSCLLPYI